MSIFYEGILFSMNVRYQLVFFMYSRTFTIIPDITFHNCSTNAMQYGTRQPEMAYPARCPAVDPFLSNVINV